MRRVSEHDPRSRYRRRLGDALAWLDSRWIMRPHRRFGLDLAAGCGILAMIGLYLVPPVTVVMAETDERGYFRHIAHWEWVEREPGVSWVMQSWPHEVFSGFVAPLFAVLIGVRLALAHRPDGAQSRPTRGTVARALLSVVVLATIGLTLASTGTRPPIPLLTYAVLIPFGVAILAFRPRPWILLAAATAWAALGPVSSYVIRQHLPPGSADALTIARWGDPGSFCLDLVFTGRFPVWTYAAFLLLGLGVGGLNVRRPKVMLSMFLVGLVPVIVAGMRRYLMNAHMAFYGKDNGVEETLLATSDDLVKLLSRYDPDAWHVGFSGTVPPVNLEWLAVAHENSGTPLDVASAMGFALALIALSHRVETAYEGRLRRVVLGVAATGSAALFWYCVIACLARDSVLISPANDTIAQLGSPLFAVCVVLTASTLWACIVPRPDLQLRVTFPSRADADRPQEPTPP